MTREERRALLGDACIGHIRDLVAAAPEPTPALIEELRRILTRPAGRPAPAAQRPAA